MGIVKDLMVIPCEECNGAGFLFWGDENSFDVESCDCVDDGSLFWNGESK